MLDYSNLKFVPFDDDVKIGEKIDVESFIKIEDGISLDQLKEIKAAFQVSFISNKLFGSMASSTVRFYVLFCVRSLDLSVGEYMWKHTRMHNSAWDLWWPKSIGIRKGKLNFQKESIRSTDFENFCLSFGYQFDKM